MTQIKYFNLRDVPNQEVSPTNSPITFHHSIYLFVIGKGESYESNEMDSGARIDCINDC